MANYKVSLMDGETISVPQLVGEAILRADSPFIKFGQRMINLKGISRIEPEVDETRYPALPEPKKFTSKERLSALQQMAKGLRKFCSENEGSTKAEAILERMNKAIEVARTSNITTQFNPAEFLN